MPDAQTYVVEMDGAVTRRGYWLYVLQTSSSAGGIRLYVGRTGDSSSFNAQSAYNRFGKHLGHASTTNQTRKYLESQGIDVAQCHFRFIAHGPLLEEPKIKNKESHYPLRDQIAAMEKALAEHLAAAGYDVLNTVASKMPLDEEAFAPVLSAFAAQFPRLTSVRS